jgi:glucosamine-phosphate N-acetyltransferase
MAHTDGLFAASLLSPEVAAALPQGYRIRALRKSDFNSGFLDCLRVLTTVGDLTEEDFHKQYERMLSLESYYIIVVEDTARTEFPVVATGALIVERKLYVQIFTNHS